MRSTIFFLISAFCVLHARSDSIVEFKGTLEKASKEIEEYEQAFHGSMLVLVSNLKDTSTEALGESWNATFMLIDISNQKAETKEKKDCIDSENKKLEEIINTYAISLDECGQNSTALGEPIRKRLQDAHQKTWNMKNDLDKLKNTCSTNTDKPEAECISLRVTEFGATLKGVLDQMPTYKIQASTIKPRLLSEAMHCNAKVLSKIHEAVTKIQENLQKCI